jgi:serine/threonine protein kinase
MKFQLDEPIEGMSVVEFEFNTSLGKGASAEIFKEKIGGRYFAVKKYHSAANVDQDKLIAMRMSPPKELFRNFSGNDYPTFAWPLSLFRSVTGRDKGDLIGYVMPIIDEKASYTLEYFYDFNLSKELKNKNSTALSFKTEIISNLCGLIGDLHQTNGLFIDLKPQNIRVFEEAKIVSLLDCDGFSIFDPIKNIKHPAKLVSTDYISPELNSANLDADLMNEAQDRYALAVIIFQMLNNGIHPFQGILKQEIPNSATNDQKAVLGLYPHSSRTDPRIAPRQQSVHQSFLDETQLLFDRAFLSQDQRPSAEEWQVHFDAVLSERLIVRCPDFPNDVEHMRFKDKGCPACYLKRVNGPAQQAKKPDPVKQVFVDQTPKTKLPPPLPPAANRSFFTSPIFIVAIAIIGAIFFFGRDKGPGKNYTPKDLCAKALNVNNDGWEDRSPFQWAVQEANRRGLSIADCRRELGPSQSSNNSSQSTVNYLSNLTSNELCRRALSGTYTSWEVNSVYREEVQEAQRLGYTIADCRRELGLSQSSSNAAQSTGIYSSYQPGDLCRAALNSQKDDWESRFPFAVQEAKRREYTIDYCRRELGLTQSSSNATQSNGNYSNHKPSDLCQNALVSNKEGWEDQPRYQWAVQEAKRREYTVNDCRSYLGYSNSNSSQPAGYYSNLLPIVLCQAALTTNGTQYSWDSTPAYQMEVQEAQRRGYTVDTCREYLGLGQGPSPIEPPYGNKQDLTEGELVYCWRHTEILKILDVKMGKSNYTEQQRNGFNYTIENIENKCKFDKKSSDIRNNRAKYVELNKENIIEEANKILEEW